MRCRINYRFTPSRPAFRQYFQGRYRNNILNMTKFASFDTHFVLGNYVPYGKSCITAFPFLEFQCGNTRTARNNQDDKNTS
ncbi:hypothetical protein PSAB6_570045 [Paraburkholderia sabiae]|nr:hypothetical protein PSAB6_570045 [Paraburkholderia sabiae]